MKDFVTFTWQGISLTAEGTYTPGARAVCYGHPDNWYPAEPAEFDIGKLFYGDMDVSFLLSCDLADDITDAMLGQLEVEDAPDYDRYDDPPEA